MDVSFCQMMLGFVSKGVLVVDDLQLTEPYCRAEEVFLVRVPWLALVLFTVEH